MTGQIDPSLGTYSYNPVAAGRKKYAGGSTFSPTMGQVDKAGYVDRENRNNIKKQAYKRWLADRKNGNPQSTNALRLQG